jgi:lipid-A-disaccharide synthase
LMDDLLAREPTARFKGVGGPAMLDRGLQSIFPMTEISVMGFVPVIKRLPSLLKRIRQTAQAILDERPDAVVLIDAQDFSKRVARILRAKAPSLLLIAYVAPSVWAWRPGRARKIAPLYDLLLALFPFEPGIMQKLGGPTTIYAGHPLLKQLDQLQPTASERLQRRNEPSLLLLPGSRRSEIERILPVFAEVGRKLLENLPNLQIILPTVPAVEALVRAQVEAQRLPIQIVTGEGAKHAAFRRATAALAASGTVALELALADVPMAVAYRVSKVEAAIVQRLVLIDTPVLPDIILAEKQTPLFLQEDCSAKQIVPCLMALLQSEEMQKAQQKRFERMRTLMQSGQSGAMTPAADAVLELASGRLTGAVP